MIKSIHLVLENGHEVSFSYEEAIMIYKELRELFDGKVLKDVVYRSRDEDWGRYYYPGLIGPAYTLAEGMKNVAKDS